MSSVPLSGLLPDADIPKDATVGAVDAMQLQIDLQLYGNAYVKPSGKDDPTHVRVSPKDVA